MCLEKILGIKGASVPLSLSFFCHEREYFALAIFSRSCLFTSEAREVSEGRRSGLIHNFPRGKEERKKRRLRLGWRIAILVDLLI